MSSFKKLFAVGSTVALLATGFLVPGSALAAAHGPGSVVKKTDGTVLFIDNNNTASAFTSGGAFLSYGFLSFSQVVDANADDLALPSGPFIAPRDGSVFCATVTKGSDVAGECSLITGGMKAAFTSASVFGGLGFSFARAKYGDSSFLVKTTNIGNTSDAHRPGVLVNNNGTVQLVGASALIGIPSLDVFNSWGYSFADVVPANGADKGITQSGVMTARTPGLLNPGATSNPGTGQMTVALASDNPASATVITTQGSADLAHFSLNGSGTVTGITLKRIGVSADASLGNVYLFDGATRITDAASVSSGSTINFNNASGLFTVNGSKTISVRADLAAQAGETLGVQLTSVTLLGGGTVTGAPVSGNLFSTAVASTFATVALAAASGSGNTDPGTGVMVWQSTVTVGNRDVLLTRLALRQIGSINSADINNFTLMVDGVQAGTSANLDSNGYVTFSLSKALMTGSRTLRVNADVIGGSGRTVSMSLRGSYDISTTDTQYNAGVIATGTFPNTAVAFTVNPGSMTVVKTSDSQSANVTIGASDQSLAKYTFTAYGEPIKVETLRAGIITTGGTVTDNTLRNVRILVNGAQVGSTTNVPAAASFAAASGTSFTTNFTVNPGTPAVVEIRGDIFDSEGTNDIAATTTTTVQALLVGGTATSNGVPQVSLTPINVPSQTNVLGNSLTIASGSMSLAKTSSYNDRSVAVPATAYKIGSFQLTGNATETININTIYVGFTAGSSVTEQTDLSDLYVVYGGTSTPVKGTVSSTILNGNSWSVNFPLGVNQVMQVDVYATLAASVSTNAIISTLAVAGVTQQSGNVVYADINSDGTLDAGFTGQTITGAAGTFVASVDASTPDSTLVDDSGNVTSAAFKFAATTDSYTITALNLTLANASAVQTVNIQDAGVTIAGGSKAAAGTLSFTGLSIPVPADTNKVLTVQLVMAPVGVGAGTTGSSLLTTLTSAVSRNSSGTSGTTDVTAGWTESPANPAGNVMYVYKAVPTITTVALPSSLLGNGTQVVSKFQINTNGTGSIAWKQVKLTISKTGGAADGALTDPTLSAFTLWDADTNTQITAASVIVSTDGDGAGSDTTANCGELDTACTVLLTVGADSDDNVEKQISGGKTYEVHATVLGALATGDNVNTSIARPSSHITSNVFTTAETSTPSFVWSDISAASHDTGTSDWSNDNLVKNLPTNSQTMTK